MDFDAFVEGPLLWIVFLIFIIGIAARLFFFFSATVRSRKYDDFGVKHILANFGRLFIPFYNGVTKKPVYAILRYIFHVCLIVVPIWLSTHIVLWTESRFEWEWTALPDVWADWMTILVIGVSAYFLFRRFIFADVRLGSSASDYVLIIITALPFLSGYFLTHGSLDAIAFLGDNMRAIHVLCGEAILIGAVFLFYRTRLKEERCTGCAACESSCPTGTLESKDEGKLRTFTYSPYQCVCCGACIHACPEEAAELRHAISIRNFFRVIPKDKIRSVELAVCKGCGALFAPEPLLARVAKTIVDDYGGYCSTCKKTKLAANFYKLAPWPKKLQDKSKKNKISTGTGMD